MACTAEKLIQTALAHVGTKETPPGSNITPFTLAYFDGNLPANPAASAPWCVIFGWYVFREAGASDIFYDGARVGSCSAVLRWANRNGLTVAVSDVRRGDIVLFDWDVKDSVPDHFGLALGSPEGGKIATVEGNTNDEVGTRSRKLADVCAAIRPRYSSEGGSYPSYEELKTMYDTLRALHNNLEKEASIT